MRELFQLFWAFFRIGAFPFGGGYAMLPMIQKEVVEKYGWATDEEVLNYFAVGQCTPGVIAVNLATFIGHKRAKLKGAITATFGVVCPSVIIILIIAAFLKNFAQYEIVKNAFSGIRVAVAVLVLNAVVKMWKSGIKDLTGFIIFLIGFLISIIFGISPIYIVIAAIIAGILIKGKEKAE
mgnify:CR=1 FL=1